MFKPKTLLKVVAILFIITGVLGIISTGFTYVMLPKMMTELQGVDTSMLEAAFTPLNMVLSVISCIASIGAGIVGVSGKSVKWATIFIAIYTVIVVISMVQMVMTGTFTALAVIDFILPALYWWGLYQSK